MPKGKVDQMLKSFKLRPENDGTLTMRHDKCGQTVSVDGDLHDMYEAYMALLDHHVECLLGITNADSGESG